MTVVPVYNIIVVPDSNIYFKTDLYTGSTGKIPEVNERVILIVAKEEEDRRDMTETSFYPIGLSGSITEVNPNGYIVVHTKGRLNIEEVSVYSDHSIELSVSKRPDIDDLDKEKAKEKVAALRNAMINFASGYQFGALVRGYISQMRTVGEIASVVSPWLDVSNEDRYAILAEDSVAKRTEALEKMLYENLERTRVNTEAKSAQEEDYQKIYRESAIRKQIEYLQKELDEMHPENVSDVRRLELKIEESGMNDTAMKEARKVLNRLKQEGQNGTEAGMLYDYLDFLTGLSWKKEPSQIIDLEEAQNILDEDHSGLKKVKERIIQQIAVMNLKKQQSGSILCFVGAPGTGKTSIGRSIARALDREYVRVSLGGVRDEADIRGHRRTYIGAMPGRIMDGISKSGVSNPVMVLDEIDKLSASYNGDPASALLEVLDPEQNNTFTDHYMNVPYDLSDVMFICTANTLDTIPAPLLNRMEVIQFQGYTPLEKHEIAKVHLFPKALAAAGIDPDELQLTDDALDKIISDYTRESGVRGLKKRMDMICRVAAVNLLKRRKDPESEGALVVTEKELRDYLDMHPLHHRKVADSAAAGIVTGLAWTQIGGEILYIETLMTKGSGKIVITGQLGDVMKESAQIAVSLVKALFPEKTDLFKDNDLHIHVPDGSTPKDGPSAGVTLTTALASLVNDQPVSPDIAMTGEISLQGTVNPIGGLPEKLMAAQRAGVHTVFIPDENMEDLRDVADEVRKELRIIPVKNIEDILKQTGVINEQVPSQNAC